MKKKNGRPPVMEESKKQYRVVAYLDKEQYENFLNECQRLGVKPSGYLRKLVTAPEKKIYERVTPEQYEVYRSLANDIRPIAQNISRAAQYASYNTDAQNVGNINRIYNMLKSVVDKYAEKLSDR